MTTRIEGYLNPDSDLLTRMLERPHKEWTEATDQETYCCSHCGSRMEIAEVEHEGKLEKVETGFTLETSADGDQVKVPLITDRLELIIYVTHLCSSDAREDACSHIELAYEL